MAIIGIRTGGALRLDIGNCRVAGLHRGRAISTRAAIRVHGAIASNVTNIRAVVRGRAATNTGCFRSTTGIGEALVVRTAAGRDQAFPGEAPAVHSAFALGVGGARCRTKAGGWVWLACTSTAGAEQRCRTALRGTLRVARAMIEGCLPSVLAGHAARGDDTASAGRPGSATGGHGTTGAGFRCRYALPASARSAAVAVEKS